MHVKEIDKNLYCKWMSGHGTFARMGVQGDGSCFFHSVCALLNKKNYLLGVHFIPIKKIYDSLINFSHFSRQNLHSLNHFIFIVSS